MPKKCIICDEEAEFKIKDGNEYYCLDCAEESFADLSVLQGVEEAARLLKQVIKAKSNGDLQNDSNLEAENIQD